MVTGLRFWAPGAAFCACGWNTVALSATPSRIGIFTPQRISGIAAAASPLSCAKLRAVGMLMLNAARRIIRCKTLFRFIQLPPPEHRPFRYVTYLRAHAWYRVTEGNPTRRNKCFCEKYARDLRRCFCRCCGHALSNPEPQHFSLVRFQYFEAVPFQINFVAGRRNLAAGAGWCRAPGGFPARSSRLTRRADSRVEI